MVILEFDENKIPSTFSDAVVWADDLIRFLKFRGRLPDGVKELRDAETSRAWLQWAISQGLPQDTRIAKLVRRANVRSLQDITAENLSGLPGCGKLTVDRLLKWKQDYEAEQDGEK